MDLFNILFTHGEAIFRILQELVSNYVLLSEDLLTMLRFCIECFEMANNVQILEYFSEDLLASWMEQYSIIIKTPVKFESTNKKNGWEKKIEMDRSEEWKIRKTIFRTLARYLQECNQDQKRGLSGRTKKVTDKFTKKIVPVMLQHAGTLLEDSPMTKLSMKTHCFLFKFLINVLNNSHCSNLIKANLDALFLKACVPALQPGPADLESFSSDQEDFLLQATGSLSETTNSLKPLAESLAAAICRLDIGPVKQLLTTGESSDDWLATVAVVLLAVSDSINMDDIFELIEKLFVEKVFPKLTNFGVLHPFMAYLLLSLVDRFVSILSEEVTDIFFNQSTGGSTSIFSLVCSSLLTNSKLNPVLLFALLKLTSTGTTEERWTVIDPSVMKQLISKVLSQNTLSSLAVTTTLLHSLISSTQGAISEIAPLVLDSMVSKWQSIGLSEKPEQSEDNEALEKLDKKELLLGRETCLESMCNILNQITLPQDSYTTLANTVSNMVKTCLLQRDEQSFHRCVFLLGTIISKTRKVDVSVASVYPIICYAYLGPPSVDFSGLSPEDKSLMEVLKWWAQSELTLESEAKFFHVFLQASKAEISSTRDPFGTPYTTLMILVAARGAKHGLAHNNSWETSAAFKVLLSALEILKDSDARLLEDEASAIKEILSQTKGNAFILTLALRICCVFLWSSPQAFFYRWEKDQFYRQLLDTFLLNFDKLHKGTKKDKKLFTVGLASLFSIEQTDMVTPPHFSKMLEAWICSYSFMNKPLESKEEEDDENWNEEPVFAEAENSEDELLETASDDAGQEAVKRFWEVDDSMEEETETSWKTAFDEVDEISFLRDSIFKLKDTNMVLLVARTKDLSESARSNLEQKLVTYKTK